MTDDGRGPIEGYVGETTEGHAILLTARDLEDQPAPDWRWDKKTNEWVPPEKAVARYADVAMYPAEPMPTGGPQVTLLSMTGDPLGEIASCAKIYRGEVCRSLKEITDEERLSYFADVQKTALDAAFEVVQFHFLFENVTRAFTHQLVRQRIGAVYFQESLRFAVKEHLSDEVALPPSLAGTVPEHQFREDCRKRGLNPNTNGSIQQTHRRDWDNLMKHIDAVYNGFVDNGMPAEDARGVLPHATTTRIHYVTNLRGMKLHSGLRLCTQAQMEWRAVWARMIEEIRGKNVLREPHPGEELDWYEPNAQDVNGTSHVWMADKLVDMFKPICYQTGKCQFDASFDRYCSIRERVNAFEWHGIPSSKWGDGDIVRGNGTHEYRLLPIQPVEWLADPAAARRPR